MMEKTRDILLAVIALVIALTVIIVATTSSPGGDEVNVYFTDTSRDTSDSGAYSSLN